MPMRGPRHVCRHLPLLRVPRLLQVVHIISVLAVLVVLAVLTAAYQVLERLVTRHPTLAARAGATLVLACAVVVGLALVG